jgi:hypothetical protein
MTRVEIINALHIGISSAVLHGYKNSNELLPDQAEPATSVQADFLRGFLVGLIQRYPLFTEDILVLAKMNEEKRKNDEEEAAKKYNVDFEPVFKHVIDELSKFTSVENNRLEIS